MQRDTKPMTEIAKKFFTESTAEYPYFLKVRNRLQDKSFQKPINDRIILNFSIYFYLFISSLKDTKIQYNI